MKKFVKYCFILFWFEWKAILYYFFYRWIWYDVQHFAVKYLTAGAWFSYFFYICKFRLELFIWTARHFSIWFFNLIFEVGSDIENHVKKMEIFFKAVNIADSDTIKVILLKTLSDATNDELFCQAEYSESKDYYWIIEKLVKIFS